MGQAVAGALLTIFTAKTIEFVIIRIILINVVLGGLGFEEDGVEYTALGAQLD